MIEISLSGDTFAIEAMTITNWAFDYGTTGLTVDQINFLVEEDESVITNKVLVEFTGTASLGTISIHAKESALTNGVASNIVSLVVIDVEVTE